MAKASCGRRGREGNSGQMTSLAGPAAARGKSLAFGPEEIDDLLDMEYGDRRLFPLLSILYAFIDVRQLHHIDHFFPKSHLQRRRLEKLNCESAYIDDCLDARDRLANLQLLDGLLNVAKNDSLPAEWVASAFPDTAQRQSYLDRHDLGKVPATALEFMGFYQARRDRMRQRLTSMLSRNTET